MQRFKDNIYVIAAGLHAGGIDWKSWVRKACAAKSTYVKDISSRSSYAELIHFIKATPCVSLMGLEGGGKKNVSDFFNVAANPEEITILNNSGCGVSIHEDDMNEKWYALISWQEAISGVLRFTPFMRKHDDPMTLQKIAARHEKILSEEKSKEVFDRVLSIKAYMEDLPHSFLDITYEVKKAHIRAEGERKRVSLKAPGRDRVMANSSK